MVKLLLTQYGQSLFGASALLADGSQIVSYPGVESLGRVIRVFAALAIAFGMLDMIVYYDVDRRI